MEAENGMCRRAGKRFARPGDKKEPGRKTTRGAAPVRARRSRDTLRGAARRRAPTRRACSNLSSGARWQQRATRSEATELDRGDTAASPRNVGAREVVEVSETRTLGRRHAAPVRGRVTGGRVLPSCRCHRDHSLSRRWSRTDRFSIPREFWLKLAVDCTTPM